ncbi:MMPL family transporter [Nonomuraea sp. NPDC050643]|uniref:MMPL family transporter n=1 Tax=Nonomuraea sp. NPDC050643 TaxID=3155660 RepID=UPI0033D258A6
MPDVARPRRYGWAVLWLTVAVFVVALLTGHDVQDRLVLGDTASIGPVPAGEPPRRAHGGESPQFVLIATAARSVDARDSAAAGGRLAATLARADGVLQVSSYWETRSPSMRSHDGRSALILARLDGDHTRRIATARRLVAELTGHRYGLSVTATGEAPIRAESRPRTEHGPRTAELIAVPLTLVILLLVFGSVVAALLPLLVAVLAVIGAMAVLRLLTEVIEVSAFAMSVAATLGSALAVAFSLFIVTRFREELARCRDPQRAIATTMRTTGRAMAYSAATVTLSLTALLLFPFTVLRSVAYGGIAITVLAAAVSLIVLPAVLALLGERVNSLPIPGPWRAGRAPGRGWPKPAAVVMRRPLLVAVPTTLLLTALASPFAGARLATLDDGVLPPQAPAAQAAQRLREDFDAGGGVAPTTIVLPDLFAAAGPRAAGSRPRGSAVLSPAVTRSVRSVRPVRATVGGAQVSHPLDTHDTLPMAVTLVALSTLSLVTALTGRVVPAVKAPPMNALGFGALFHLFRRRPPAVRLA